MNIDEYNYAKEKLNNKKCALFDLDGTLVDTAEDLGKATAFVLEQFGREAKWSDSDYRAFVGNGARKLLERAFEYTLTEKELDKAFEIFRKKYNVILNDNARLYNGIKESLDILKGKGMKLAVVTNKPHQSAVIMVEHFFGNSYFDLVIGAQEDKPKKPDPYSANSALEKLGCSAEEAVFFGDSDVDVLTAKNAGIDAVGCLWGFRSFDVLNSASPLLLIDNPKYIAKLF